MSMQILIKKTGSVIETGDFPEVSREFIFNYGLRQILNDCHSSVKQSDFRTEAEFFAAVMEAVTRKLTALEQGQITVRKSAEPTSPLDKIIQRIATANVGAALKKKGIARKTLPEGRFEELVESYVEKHHDTLAETARQELARLESMPDFDIDLESLKA